MAAKKKVIVKLPRIPAHPSMAERYAMELEALEPIGVELVEVTTWDADELTEAARDADGILTCWGVPIDAKMISKMKNCKVIGLSSIGVDMVDVDAATDAGIVVTNVPDIFIEEVADHAMMLLLAMARLAKTMVRVAQEGQWFEARATMSTMPRLMGQTLGLLGFGNVARATARRAKPFGLRITAYDPYVSETRMVAEGVQPVGFAELIENSDYLSIHTPLNDETRHMIGARQFKAMKPSAVIINSARGPIIDEAALIEALRSGEIAAAGLDVLEQEPPAKDNPLLSMPNALVTPHVAAASTRMRPETRRRAAREVAMVLSGRWPMSCVNPLVLPRTQLTRWQPYSMDRGQNR